MRWVDPLPPRRPLPTILPTRGVRCPWTLPDGFTRSWICAWPWSDHGAADLRETTRTGKRTSWPVRRDRRGPRSTSRTQSVESMRRVAGYKRKKGERTPEVPLAEKSPGEPGAPFHYQNTRGRSEKQSGDPAQTRRVPPLPDYPPGLSGTMGSTSPDSDSAAETAAARRHPSGPARAATAQSTVALALAPAPPAPPL